MTEPEAMCAAATAHFQELLGTPAQRSNALNLDALNLPVVDLLELEIPFSEAEIWEAIKGLPPDKAPGPMGSLRGFIRFVGP